MTLLLLLVSMLVYIYVSADELTNITFIALWTGVLIFLCYGGNRLSRFLFENRVVQYLGTISYSMYLTHYLILENLPEIHNKTLFFVALVAGTIIASTITYFLIEKPFIIIGKNLTK